MDSSVMMAVIALGCTAAVLAAGAGLLVLCVWALDQLTERHHLREACHVRDARHFAELVAQGRYVEAEGRLHAVLGPVG